MRILLNTLLLAGLLLPQSASAFCGFYVAKADTSLFNKASKVVLVRDGDRTVLTMANDYQGKPKEFAIVVPVPTMLEKGQINVGDTKTIEHLDAYTAPRLVEYFDQDPCSRRELEEMSMADGAAAPSSRGLGGKGRSRAKKLGVTIEAEYTVGEYDILILSAKESDGLETWLREEGYKVPKGAKKVLSSYIKQKNRFFVAKVNLEEHSKLGFSYLRPLQVAYESPKFMLPIRLGTVNAKGTQELFVFALTKDGRVETTNYRTVKLPSNMEIPPYVKDEFSDFYQSMFTRQVKAENMKAVFMEYAWDMSWCDPCAADPLTSEELRSLGVWWTGRSGNERTLGAPRGAAQNVFVTRLHVRYDGEHFPQDLEFQQTGDRQNFQGRYILRHPWEGEATCSAAEPYFQQVDQRKRKEAEVLARLTGWKLSSIHKKMDLSGGKKSGPKKNWWQNLWGN